MEPVPSRIATLLILLVGIVSAAPAAQATVSPAATEAKAAGIVPGQSIDGVKLGESGAQVERALGKPTAGQISGGYLQYYPPSALDGEVYFDAHGKVDGVLTSNKHFSTAKGGVHVGSLLSAVPKAYPKAQIKQTEFGSEAVLTSTEAGQGVITVFHSAVGKKTIVGIEIDFQSAVG